MAYDENEILNSTAALVVKKKKNGLMAWNIVENGGGMLLLSEFTINKDSIHVQFPNEISSAALTRDSLKLINFTIKKDSSLYHFVERIREEK
ncbi:MAG: hypothetical protein HYZ43_17560 [Flavobacteriia bacterium]|nr:hypothetical protein [Flavobacteriia bacterium]